MKRTELAIIGAGPAGLSAACQAARLGVQTLLIDEYTRPGGQLIKQIHKFFGSEAHKAGVRGIDIAAGFLKELEESPVEMMLGASVWSIFPNRVLSVAVDGRTQQIRAEKIILATGASENALGFPGWTLPGVMTAGAAQTSMNINRILPGKKVLMIGAGNVGVIISYQLLQAGAQEVTIIEAKDQIGAYQVHASKVKRLGVDILTGHTVKEVTGYKNVTFNEPFFQGHFPDEPVMPGVLILEAMGQVGAVLMKMQKEFQTGERKLVYLTSIDNAKFRKPVKPGDQLRTTARLKRRRGSMGKFEFVATVDGEIVAQAEMGFHIASGLTLEAEDKK